MGYAAGYQWDWTAVTDNIGLFLRGAELTMTLSVLTMLLSTVGGLVLMLLRLSRWRLVRAATVGYVEAFRTTPFLVQIFWIFYGLPYVFGITLHPFIAALSALSLNVSAFNSEIFRAGVMSVSPGQRLGGLAIGMSHAQVMWRVVLPQAVRRIIPPLGIQWVSMFQNTSLVSFIGVSDLMSQSLMLRANTYRSLEILTATALIYIALGYPQARFVSYLYKRVRTHEL